MARWGPALPLHEAEVVSASHPVCVPSLNFIPGLVSVIGGGGVHILFQINLRWGHTQHLIVGALPAALGSPHVSLGGILACLGLGLAHHQPVTHMHAGWSAFSVMTYFIRLSRFRAEEPGPGAAPHPESLPPTLQSCL